MGDIKLFQIGQNQQVQQLLTGAMRVQVGDSQSALKTGIINGCTARG